MSGRVGKIPLIPSQVVLVYSHTSHRYVILQLRRSVFFLEKGLSSAAHLRTKPSICYLITLRYPLTRRCMSSRNSKARTAFRTNFSAKNRTRTPFSKIHGCKFLEGRVASAHSKKPIKLLPTSTNILNTSILTIFSRSRMKTIIEPETSLQVVMMVDYKGLNERMLYIEKKRAKMVVLPELRVHGGAITAVAMC